MGTCIVLCSKSCQFPMSLAAVGQSINSNIIPLEKISCLISSAYLCIMYDFNLRIFSIGKMLKNHSLLAVSPA